MFMLPRSVNATEAECVTRQGAAERYAQLTMSRGWKAGATAAQGYPATVNVNVSGTVPAKNSTGQSLPRHVTLPPPALPRRFCGPPRAFGSVVHADIQLGTRSLAARQPFSRTELADRDGVTACRVRPPSGRVAVAAENRKAIAESLPQNTGSSFPRRSLTDIEYLVTNVSVEPPCADPGDFFVVCTTGQMAYVAPVRAPALWGQQPAPLQRRSAWVPGFPLLCRFSIHHMHSYLSFIFIHSFPKRQVHGQMCGPVRQNQCNPLSFQIVLKLLHPYLCGTWVR